MKPIIEIRGLGKSYEGRPVLADINLEIGPGELICVIGASGCGKSTLLNLTGGFVKASRRLPLSLFVLSHAVLLSARH